MRTLLCLVFLSTLAFSAHAESAPKVAPGEPMPQYTECGKPFKETIKAIRPFKVGPQEMTRCIAFGPNEKENEEFEKAMNKQYNAFEEKCSSSVTGNLEEFKPIRYMGNCHTSTCPSQAEGCKPVVDEGQAVGLLIVGDSIKCEGIEELPTSEGRICWRYRCTCEVKDKVTVTGKCSECQFKIAINGRRYDIPCGANSLNVFTIAAQQKIYSGLADMCAESAAPASCSEGVMTCLTGPKPTPSVKPSVSVSPTAMVSPAASVTSNVSGRLGAARIK